jgi:uncharacterized protein YqgC (DUF456 family)
MSDPNLFTESLVFGFAVVFMVIGLAGTIFPILPGIPIIWLSALFYAVVEGFEAIDPFTFIVLTLMAAVAGTADIWMSALGAKTGGASGRSMLYGCLGSLIGFIVGTVFVIGQLIGALIGYVLGILLSEYQKHRDWNLAIKASLGGLAGRGLAAAVQFGAGLLMLIIFVWQVLSF